jgi:hypothetical protein
MSETKRVHKQIQVDKRIYLLRLVLLRIFVDLVNKREKNNKARTNWPGNLVIEALNSPKFKDVKFGITAIQGIDQGIKSKM